MNKSDLLNTFTEKVKVMNRCIKKEYENIMTDYSDEKIYKKSYPIKATKKATLEQSIDVEKFIQEIFNPSLNTISKLIDSGFIEWAYASQKVDLNVPDEDLLKNLIYECCDKLYVLKHIKYNISMNFIMQLYLFLEREINILINKVGNIQQRKTLFSAIKYIELEYNIEISKDVKSKLNLYRNVINVHKHGYGDSFNEIQNNYKHILNSNIIINNDPSFIFKMEIINFHDIYELIDNFINEIKKNLN